MKVSEQFYSLQGEGIFTGVPSYFIRFFGCSLQCQGFGQKEPANPETWVQPWKTINIKKIEKLEDLPAEIYEYGCDSVYSWSAKFKHLQQEMTAKSVVDKMESDLGVLFEKVYTGDVHIVWTGGEPLLKFNQKYILEIIEELRNRNPLKSELSDMGWDSICQFSMTIETNGTQHLLPELKTELGKHNTNISCSPKLLHTSGEKPEKAIKPDAIKDLFTIDGATTCLKFVLADTDEAKTELLNTLQLIQDKLEYIKPLIYLMPEGPNKYRVQSTSRQIAEFAMKHGFRFSDRLHAHLWDNKIGV